ncbi:MAG TPA: S1 RNA-binding domain-containing protein [Isosphaeraceae bacterium]|nr:S1 RNA-binding domain-containing protein [Isosphaeraceae bacterium]
MDTPAANAPRPRRDDPDEAIDAALEAASRRAAPAPPRELPLKKQWDAELEAELERALEGFDNSRYEVATPRRDRTQQGDEPAGQRSGRGQETRQGPQQGKVVAVRGESVFIDLGAKSEGVVPVEQFQGKLPSPGDVIEVIPDRFDPDEGLLLLSLKGAAVEANWENLRKGLIVEARVTKSNKGGLEVEVDGIRGFLPISQIDLNRVEDAAVYIGQKLKVLVTEADPRQRNLVVSRREVLERERAELREQTWAELAEGQVRPGVIRSVKTFGAFVDLGGVDGLIHVSDLSWARVQDAGSVVKVGQEVQVKVLKIDRQTNKLSLGLKQLMPSPWDLVAQKYHRGMNVTGRVTRLMEFGAFVEIEPGLEGLIHITELSPTRVRRVSDIVKPEQEVEVRILSLDADAHKISLSLKPLPKDDVPDDDDEEDEAPRPPRPERKVPLKGGLGDGDPLF